jgi:predicted methyltransferase
MSESKPSFPFVRLFLFLFFLAIAIAGFSTFAYLKIYGESTSNTVNVAAAPTSTPPDDKINRPVSEPYVGDLSIFEDAKREENLQINRVMDILGLKAGTSIADLGAGSGWFTLRAARRVGDQGVVYAVEINQDYLNHIATRAETEKLVNIKTILGKEDDPTLPERSVDAVLILKTYHEISEPIRLLENLRKSLRPNAKIGIIDRNGKGDDHGIAQETVVKEATQAGFKLIEKYDFVKPDGMDYFLVLQVK